MAFHITDPIVGNQPINEVSTVKRHPFGQKVRAVDPVYGAGEFVYMKGVASTVLGSWAHLNMDDGTTALTVADAIGPVGVAMAILDATTKFGWYQVWGKAVGKASADFADNGRVYMTATPGEVDDAVVDGDMVHLAKGAHLVGTPSAGLAEFEIAYPYTDDTAGND